MQELHQFHDTNGIIKTQKYPEQFDPKWIVTESGWPYFHLSAIDNQPWKGMYHETERLTDSFQEMLLRQILSYLFQETLL